MAAIQGIFFDLGNVLVKFDANIAARKLSKAFHVSEIQLWKDLFISDLERSYTTGKISSLEFFNQIKARYGGSLDFETFAEMWNDIFTENDGMLGLVESLSKRYPLYLISNTNELHFEFIKLKFPVLKYFKRHFPSHEVGYRKPDEAIFHHALKESSLKAEESVFIDDIKEFVEASRRAGIHGIQFVSYQRLIQDLKELGIRW